MGPGLEVVEWVGHSRQNPDDVAMDGEGEERLKNERGSQLEGQGQWEQRDAHMHHSFEVWRVLGKKQP